MLAVVLFALVATLIAGAPTDDAAQPRGHAPSVLTLPAGSSSLALGGAFPVAGASSDAVFVQPGVVDRSRGIRLGVQRWGGGSTLVDLSGAREWWSGGVALGIRALAHSLPAGATLPAGEEADLFRRDSVGVSDLVATAGYGRRVGAAHLGGAVKWIVRRTGGAETATAAADVGVALSFLEDARVGLAVQNLGPGLEGDGIAADLPRQIRLDASVLEYAFRSFDERGATHRIGIGWR